MSGRERHDLLTDADEVLRFARHHHDAGFIQTVIQRADADGITGSDKRTALRIIEDEGVFRVKHGEHIGPIALVQRQKDLTVAVADKLNAACFQLFAQRTEPIDLPVADEHAAIADKRLHTAVAEPHDGEPVKAEQAVSGIQDARVIRSARDGRGKPLIKARAVGPSAEISHDRTHCHSPLSDHR